MIKIAAFFIVALAFFQTASAQFNFRKHKVRVGEDVYSIAKEYSTTSEAIFDLNPSAASGIYPDMFLVIPHSLDVPDIPPEGLIFKKHKTKKKHTLYSIAKKYKVEIADIKKYNPFLKDEPLRKGDILRIPLPKPKYISVVRTLGEKRPETQIYTVQPKETRYGIARKFGVTIPELENMNPNLGEDFPIGMKILVPKEVKNETPIVKEDFELYEVPAKQTMYSLSKIYGIPQDSIVTLNPTVQEGLKVGMVLKLPRINPVASDEGILDLTPFITVGNKASIALVLPFCVNKFDTEDQVKLKSQLSKNRVTQISADIYSGAKLAIDKAASLGVETDVVVLDSERNETTISKLVEKHNLQSKDAIIGPAFHKNAVKLAKKLVDVPVFSFSNKSTGFQQNLYQTLPSTNTLQEKIIDFVKADTLPKHILIITDKDHEATKSKLLAAFPNAKTVTPVVNKVGDSFVKVSDLEKTMGEKESDLPYWVFLESSDVALLSNVVSLLNARVQTHKVTLFTTDKNKSFDNEAVPNLQLSNLHFHYPKANKLIESGEGWFYTTYKEKHGVNPNQYAVRAYDLTLDVLLRLAYAKGEKTLLLSGSTTEYLENKFNYELNGGSLQNKASYIIKYGDDLTFEVLN